MASIYSYLNKTIGKLTITDIEYKGKNAYFICKCACGNIKSIFSGSVITGHTKSCGCLKVKSDKNLDNKFKYDLIGQTFGYLEVLDQAGRDKRGEIC